MVAKLRVRRPGLLRGRLTSDTHSYYRTPSLALRPGFPNSGIAVGVRRAAGKTSSGRASGGVPIGYIR
jgi:hypothetical protein